MSNLVTSGLLPAVSTATDPDGLLSNLTLLNLSTLDLTLFGSTLAHTSLSLSGASLTLPMDVDLGGILGTETADSVRLAADTILGSAVLGGGNDSLIAPVTAIVNGTIDAGDGNDTITIGAGDATLQGGAGNDVLTALGAGNNVIDGGAGNDTMIGGSGDDTYIVGAAGDQIIENSGGGTDTVRSSVSYTLGNNVENLILTGHVTTNATGNALDNHLTGTDQANTLSGLAGNDTIDGGAGADTMIGGSGNDTYIINSSGDHIVERANEGYDTVQSTVSYVMEDNVERLELEGTNSTSGVGNQLNNDMEGNVGDNRLSGLDGQDVLSGGRGADMLSGGDGNDTLDGGDGNDTLIGGAGIDHMTGGAGNDVFRFAVGDFEGSDTKSADIITDFTPGADKIDLGQLDASSLHSGNQAFTFIGFAAFDHQAGQLMEQVVGSNTFLFGDANGDGKADFSIELAGKLDLTASDFIL